MKKLHFSIRLFVMLAIIFTTTHLNSLASHFAGSDLFYECLGNDQYRVTFVFYRDCAGISEPGSIGLLSTNLCTGASFVTTLTKKPDGNGFVNGLEVSTTCTGVLSTCNGGSAPGLRKWVYEGVVTLSSTCDDWRLSYEECCRNSAITTLQNIGGESLYTECVLKTSVCDNAPQFSNDPIAFACVNQGFNYNQGAFDPDGDSLAYELDDPLSTGGLPVIFNPGYSSTNPFTVTGTFNLDATTGAVTFTPSILQVGVFVVKVKQYRNGQVIGYVRRDMQMYVVNCTNTLPTLSGFDGTNNYQIQTCVDEQLCADILSNDVDAGQQLTVTWNGAISGATFIVGGGLNPTGTFCWTPDANDIANNPHVFTVTVKDDACPTNGVQTFSYVVEVVGKPGLQTSSTDAGCAGNDGSATVSTFPNYSILWSNGSTDATITGLTPGTYTVTVTNPTNCSSTASVVVGTTVVALNISGSVTDDNGTCNGKIDITVSGGVPPYTYSWSNGSTDEDPNNLCAGTYTVDVFDASQCTGKATFTVGLSGGCNMTLSVKSNDEGYCKYGGIVFASISGSTGPCTAVLTDGTGAFVDSKNCTNVVTFDSLKSDNYTVTVTDANGCSATANAFVGTGICGAPVDVEVINVLNTKADVIWNDCQAIKHVVRYKVSGANNPYLYKTVNNANIAHLKNLTNNTIYSVRVRAKCGNGKGTQWTVPVQFCTGGCPIPKLIPESDMLDDDNMADESIAFSINPNPATDLINVVGECSAEKNSRLIITDMLGKEVMNVSIELYELFEQSVNVSALNKGVYFVKVEGFETFTQRFVKQ